MSDEESKEVEVDTAGRAIYCLDQRTKMVREMLEDMCKEDEIKVPADQVINLLVQSLLNQITIMGTLQTLLVKEKRNEL